MKNIFDACSETRFLVGTSGALLVIQVNNLNMIRLSRATAAPF